jgi:CheY-like chemotaxis protein
VIVWRDFPLYTHAVEHWRGSSILTPLKILVVDDTQTNIVLLTALLQRQGHSVVTARDGLEAINTFMQAGPDIILMDVMMPNMDGIDASRHIRKISSSIPIIFLSAAKDETLIAQGLEIGSDYIVKPIQPTQLTQKLNAHFRSVLAYREVVEKNREIQRLHDTLFEENRIAAHVLSRILSRMLPPSDSVEFTVIPSGIFSGDIVLTGTTPSGRLNVLLADAIGHGLPAAFSLMPIIPAFDAMTRKGFPLEDILFEINGTLQNVMPVGRFVAATAVSIDFKAGLCDVWVGGNPRVVRLSQRTLKDVPSSNLALGLANRDDRASFVCTSIQLAPDERLVFWSDGLSEAWDQTIKANAGDLSEFLVACDPAEVFGRVMEQVNDHNRHDDTSLVVLHMEGQSDAESLRRAPIAKSSYSRIDLDLDVQQLKMPDPSHAIIDLAHRIGMVEPADGTFGFVFTELFANALDHGVLEMSSEVKYASENGMENYRRIREEKLASLEQGHIKVEIEATEFSGQPATRLRVVDSGAGFDQSLLISDGDFSHKARAGRGFQLVMNMCITMSYSGVGNDVTVYLTRNSR